MENRSTAGAHHLLALVASTTTSETNLEGDGIINCTGNKGLTDFISTRLILGCMYVLIFLLAVSGNVLVVYVVVNNKAMQTVTNIFITNLAISDLMVNFTSLWLTPMYTYVGHWIWGGWLCYGLPLFQGTSIFISTLTLMAIAVDRYFVIVHHSSSSANLNDHMSMPVCIGIITLIWTVSLLLVMPYAVHMRMTYVPRPCNFWLCIEDWAMEDLKSMYGVIVMALQFIVPFVIIGLSYISIWNFLNARQSLVIRREREYENARKKRLLRMLIIMVVVFGICWFPFNLLNILRDLHLDSFIKPQFSFLFLSVHVISMTATCWNPIVYAWMNEAFRKHFIAAIPFLKRYFKQSRRSRPRMTTNFIRTDLRHRKEGHWCTDELTGYHTLSTMHPLADKSFEGLSPILHGIEHRVPLLPDAERATTAIPFETTAAEESNRTRTEQRASDEAGLGTNDHDGEDDDDDGSDNGDEDMGDH